ncbi:hypothetical protein QR680_004064 [Steinernema hermaphroditum]|nr:hypothetical protein QR680_004064 [Steinernema hermaphroditum]
MFYEFVSQLENIMTNENEEERGAQMFQHCSRHMDRLRSLGIYQTGSEAPTNEFASLPRDVIKEVLNQEQSLIIRHTMEKLCKLDGPWGKEARSFQPLVCHVNTHSIVFNRYSANHNGWTCRKQTERRMEMTLKKKNYADKRITESLIQWPSPSTAQRISLHAENMCDHLFLAGDHAIVPILPKLNPQFSDIILSVEGDLTVPENVEVEKFVIKILKNKNLRKLYINLGLFSTANARAADRAFRDFLVRPTFEWLDMPNNCLEAWVLKEVVAAWRKRKIFEVISQDIRTTVRNNSELNDWVKRDFNLLTGEDMVLWERDEVHTYDPEQTMRIVVFVQGENPSEVEVSLVFERKKEVYSYEGLRNWWDYYKAQLSMDGSSRNLMLMY